MSEETQASVPLDKLARVYRKIKAKKQELTAEYDSKVAELDAQLNVLQTQMKDQLLAAGVKSVNTTEGTIILATTTRYHTTDWDAFKDFVRDNDLLDLFEKRIAQTNMAKFLTDNPDKVPPGLNSNSEYTVSVRKPK